MKNVLTIVVPFTAPWTLPYGAATVNGILHHHGYRGEIWDLSIDLITHFESDPSFASFTQVMSIGGYSLSSVDRAMLRKVLAYTKKRAKEKVKEIDPDYVLFSVFSSQSLEFLVPLSSIMREICPDAYMLAGGRGLDNVERKTQMIYGEYYAKYLPLDAVYLGDAENQLIETIENHYQGCFKSRQVSAEELSNVPPAVWEGLDFSQYHGFDEGNLRIPLTASKGCVRQCTFCDVAGSWPKYVFRKGSDVGREIISLYHKYDINKIEFTDNLINGSISNFREMNETIAKELPNVLDYTGYAICRPRKEMSQSDFELASIAGARRLKVGIESGSEKVRHDIKKKFSNDDIDWFTENCDKYNIKQVWLLFCGYPTETEEDFQETLALLERYKALAQKGSIEAFLTLPMMLTSNSGFMLNYSENYGLEHNRDDSWSDFFWTSTKYPNNTFEVRVDRWRRLMAKIQDCGYFSTSPQSQLEKFTELDGIEKIYKEHYGNQRSNIIPIVNSDFNINKNTHM